MVVKTSTTRVIRKTTTTKVLRDNSSDDHDIPEFFAVFSLAAAFFIISCIAASLRVLTLTHDRYIRPYLTDVVAWKPELAGELYTYDLFNCDSVTARSSEELIIRDNFTSEEIFDRMMTHGSGIFTDLAEEDLLLQVRDYILWRNQRISITENIPVIQTNNRYSFGWDVHEVPILSDLLHQISTRNPQLQIALEGLLGRNPALVELSTITATEGAKQQRWHHDMDYLHSAPLLGRSFQHMYSLLIPLQDTTTSMGSTWVAPGTHYCANTDAEGGFSVAGGGIWGNGNGLLYHSAVVHRGGEHFSGPERVALIFSFTSRPDASHFNELSTRHSRLLSRGSVFAIRHNHWGFTWNDLKDSNTSMFEPEWSSYGIYKPPDQDWGWTYLRSACFRMMHDQGGFMLMDLQAFVSARLFIFKYIPSFLLGTVADFGEEDDYAPWPRFLSETVRNVCNAFTLLQIIICASVFSLWLSTSVPNKSESTDIVKSRRKAMIIVLVILSSAYTGGFVLWFKIQSMPFALSLDSKTMVSHPFSVLDRNETFEAKYRDSIVAADINDILISTRLHHDAQFQQCRWLDYHTANRRYMKYVMQHKKSWMSYRAMGEGFQNKFLSFITQEALRADDSRITNKMLKQNKYSDWTRLSWEETTSYTRGILLRLWSLPYTEVHFGGAFWVGPCACRQSQRLCQELLVPPFSSRTNEEKSMGTHYRTKAPFHFTPFSTSYLILRNPSTKKMRVQFTVGDEVETQISYLRTRRWYPGTVKHLNATTGYARIQYKIPVQDEFHPLSEIRRVVRSPRLVPLMQPPLKSRSLALLA